MEFDYTPAVNAAKQGDAQAFAFLYEKSYPVLKREALKYMKNDFDADDVLQNTYLSVYRNLGTLRDPARFIPWAIQICRNYSINECVRSSRVAERTEFRPAISEEEQEGLDTIAAASYDTAVNPEAALEQNETRRLLDEILEDLPAMQRTCIMLWQEEYSTKEIAAMTQLPEGTVKSNVTYAKRKIRDKVLQLEKKGTKLYGMAPLAFFIWLVRAFSQTFMPAPVPAGASGSLASVTGALRGLDTLRNMAASGQGAAPVRGAEGVQAARSGSGLNAAAAKAAGTEAQTGLKAAGAAAGTAAKAGFGGKIAALIVAGVVAVGGITGGAIALSRRNSDPQPTTVVSENRETLPQMTQEGETAAAPVKETTAVPVTEPETTEPETTEPETTEAADPTQDIGVWGSVYLDWLRQNMRNDESVTFVYLNADEVPELVLQKREELGGTIRVMTVRDGAVTVILEEDYAMRGGGSSVLSGRSMLQKSGVVTGMQDRYLNRTLLDTDDPANGRSYVLHFDNEFDFDKNANVETYRLSASTGESRELTADEYNVLSDLWTAAAEGADSRDLGYGAAVREETVAKGELHLSDVMPEQLLETVEDRYLEKTGQALAAPAQPPEKEAALQALRSAFADMLGITE